MEFIITKDFLYRNYIILGKSQRDIAKEVGCTPKNINYYVRKFNLKGIKSKTKYYVNESLVDVSNPVFCYLAGLTATDGHIDYKNNRITIRVSNEGSNIVLQNILNYFENGLDVAHYKTGYEIRMTSKKLIEELKLLNVEGRLKTYTLKFPNEFKNDDCARMYLRGMLDGDGNIHLRKSKAKSVSTKYTSLSFRIVTASTDYIQGLTDYINKKFGFNYEVTTSTIKGVSYPKLEMKALDSITLLDFIYKGFEDFRFNDKYCRYKLIKGEEIV